MQRKYKASILAVALVTATKATADIVIDPLRIGADNVRPSTVETDPYSVGQLTVGSGTNRPGTLEINANQLTNGHNWLYPSYVHIGVLTAGELRVIGNGLPRSAGVSVQDYASLIGQLAGKGTLTIEQGGVYESNDSIYFATSGSIISTTSLEATVDGFGSLLSTVQSPIRSSSLTNDSGRIYLGKDHGPFSMQQERDETHSHVLISNGGKVEALSLRQGNGEDFAAIYVTPDYFSSTSLIDVNGMGSTLHADSYLQIGGDDADTVARVSVTDGASLVVDSFQSAGIDIAALAATAELIVGGDDAYDLATVSSAADIKIGGAINIAGLTATGIPVADFVPSLVATNPVLDYLGRELFGRNGRTLTWVPCDSCRPTLLFDEFIPETFTEPYFIEYKQSGLLAVRDNGQVVAAKNVEVSYNSADPKAVPYASDLATVEVSGNGQLFANAVNVNEHGQLLGDGTIFADVHLLGGVIQPGIDAGALTVQGSLFLTQGTVELQALGYEQSDPGVTDQFQVATDVQISSEVNFMITLGADYKTPRISLDDFFPAPAERLYDLSFDPANQITIETTPGGIIGPGEAITLVANDQEFVLYTDGGTPPPPPAGTGVIGDLVWNDLDADGWQDANEPGLPDVTVNLWLNCDSSNVVSTTTDANGAFAFENLQAGNYRLEFVLPTGYQFSPQLATGTYGNDSNPNTVTGLDACRTLADGQARNGLDAGLYITPTTETITLENIIYDPNDGLLWMRVSSDLAPTGSSDITATAIYNGIETPLGTVGWKANKGFYQQVFFNITCPPDEIIFTSDTGAELVAPVPANGGNCTPVDTVEVLQAIYFTSTQKLWVKAQSDASPAGSANLTAVAITNGAESPLGSVGWKPNRSAYQQSFFNIASPPDSVRVESDLGGIANLTVTIQN